MTKPLSSERASLECGKRENAEEECKEQFEIL